MYITGTGEPCKIYEYIWICNRIYCSLLITSKVGIPIPPVKNHILNGNNLYIIYIYCYMYSIE